MNTLTAPNVIANTEQVRMLDLLDTRLRWLSAWTIHNANDLRESRDELKVGGHHRFGHITCWSPSFPTRKSAKKSRHLNSRV
jgi:hypothetical protein